jgi:hypothetical protein
MSKEPPDCTYGVVNQLRVLMNMWQQNACAEPVRQIHRNRLSYIRDMGTYSKVEGQLGTLVLNLREVACFLVCFEPVGKGGGVYASQQAEERKYCPHRGCDYRLRCPDVVLLSSSCREHVGNGVSPTQGGKPRGC